MEVLESCMVAPSEETPKHGIWLSNLDLIHKRLYMPGVQVYRPNSDPDFFSLAVLKAALGKALVPFYPLAGRLRYDCDGRVEINCTGGGVLFVVARSDSTIDGFDFTPSPELKRVLVPAEESVEPPCVLLMFQVTFFKCGGVCLGTASHHNAVDGLSLFHFINTWSHIARGAGGATDVPPFLDRSLLRARYPPAVHFDHAKYSSKPHPNPPIIQTPLESSILKLSKDQLNSLKNKCINRKKLSTFKVVVAHLWRCACVARKVPADQETRVYMPVDARGRLRPPLPAGYLGNAVFNMSVAATAGEVVSNPIEFSVEKIDGVIARSDDEYVRSLIDYLESLTDDRKAQGLTLPATDLFVNSWMGLPLYEADFGWGKPVFTGPAVVYRRGSAYILQSPGDDEGLSVLVSFELENMQQFKKVFYEDLGFVIKRGLGGDTALPKALI